MAPLPFLFSTITTTIFFSNPPSSWQVLKAGLPTRVPHSSLLGPSGVGGAPPSVAELVTGKPLTVRVALVLKLHDVPTDAYVYSENIRSAVARSPTDVATSCSCD